MGTSWGHWGHLSDTVRPAAVLCMDAPRGVRVELATVEPPRTCRRIFEPQAPGFGPARLGSPRSWRLGSPRGPAARARGVRVRLHLPEVPEPQAPAPPGQPPRGPGVRVHPEGAGWSWRRWRPGGPPDLPRLRADPGHEPQAQGSGFTPRGRVERATVAPLRTRHASNLYPACQYRASACECSPGPRLHPVNLPEVLVFRFTPRGPGGAGDSGAPAELPDLPTLRADPGHEPQAPGFGFTPRGPRGAGDGGALADLPADLRAPGPGSTRPAWGPRGPGVWVRPKGSGCTCPRSGSGSTCRRSLSPRPRLHPVNLPEALVFGFTPRGPGGAGDGGAPVEPGRPSHAAGGPRARAPGPGVRVHPEGVGWSGRRWHPWGPAAQANFTLPANTGRVRASDPQAPGPGSTRSTSPRSWCSGSPRGFRVERVTVAPRWSGWTVAPRWSCPTSHAAGGPRARPQAPGSGFTPRGPGGAGDGGALADLPADLRAPGPGVWLHLPGVPEVLAFGFTPRCPAPRARGPGPAPRARGPGPAPPAGAP